MIATLTFLGFSVPLTIAVIAALLAILAFEVAMFVSAWRNPDITDSARILWLVGMVVIHPIVAIIYYFTEYRDVS